MTLLKSRVLNTKRFKIAAIAITALTALSACNKEPSSSTDNKNTSAESQQVRPQLIPEFENRLDIYKEVTLSADLSHLSDNQTKMLALLIDASKIMDDLFWQQAFSQDKKTFLASIKNEKVRRFSEINYGPWDRLDGDKVFLTNYDAKAHGAEFYPKDMTKAEFEKATLAEKEGLYYIIDRDDEGQLCCRYFRKSSHTC